MEHQLQSSMEPTKIVCPHCGEQHCFKEVQSLSPTEELTSYMCVSCGYTTTTLNVEGSAVVAQYEAASPNLMTDLRWVDSDTNLVWYPIVLNFPSFGIIFPDGTSKYDWKWRAGLAVDIPAEDRKNYPVPGGSADEFYSKRIDMENSKLFDHEDFYNACKYLGFIKE